MGQSQVKELFYENPGRIFQLREVGRLLKKPKSTVAYEIKALERQSIVKRVDTGIFPGFTANQGNPEYIWNKKNEYIIKIIKSGVVNFLEDKINPGCIILFGSVAKGEHDSKSDIDLFIQSEEIRADLGNFEKKLGHQINLFFSPSLKTLGKEMYNNIINGIKLSGYIKAK